ncbi:hypothetical protein [Zobellella aerophila]|uniref:hypothetical protein n=1 Tax=Zobellella aerophila TaxID=870480 RepID=UPI0031F12384
MEKLIWLPSAVVGGNGDVPIQTVAESLVKFSGCSDFYFYWFFAWGLTAFTFVFLLRDVDIYINFFIRWLYTL